MPLVWITISHPGMAESDTIGDMVRMKLIRAAFERLGWDVQFVMADGLAQQSAAYGTKDEAPKRRSLKARLRALAPLALWSTLKDVTYRRLNDTFYDLLEARTGPRPDLIVDYNFYFNDAAMRFGKRHGIPVVLNSETLIEDSMRDTSFSLLRGAGRRFEQDKYRRADRMWTVSEPLAVALRDVIGGDVPRVEVVPNAADAVPDAPAPPVTLPENAVVVGFVGGFSPWYALDRLVAACARIRVRVPNLHLLLVGDGPERARIEAMLAAMPPGWYTLTGRVPHSAVPGYLSLFDVGVITNHKWWTSPLKLLEYGAQGMAVVAPDLPSITTMASREAVAYFAHDDFEAFEQTLEGVLTDASRREKLAETLRQTVEGRYSLDALATTIRQSLSGLVPAEAQRIPA